MPQPRWLGGDIKGAPRQDQIQQSSLSHSPISAVEMSEIFRETVLGKALMEILDEMVRAGVLQSKLGLAVLEHFDRVVAHTLNTEVKAKVTFKARRKHTHTHKRKTKNKPRDDWHIQAEVKPAAKHWQNGLATGMA